MGSPTVLLRVADTLICSGIEKMVVPEGGAHVRSTEVRIPATFAGRPTVTATVHALTGPASAGVVFGIYSIKVNELGSAETQVAIDATNVTQEGGGIDGDFVCDYVIIGTAASQ